MTSLRIGGKSIAQPMTTVTNKHPSSLPLLIIACISAVFISLVTALAGGIASALIMVSLVFVVAALFNFRIGVLTAVAILPLSATRLLPRELFGIKGLNPLNGVVIMSALAIVLLCAFSPKRVVMPRFPKITWVYVGIIIAWGIFGATHAELIPFDLKLRGVAGFDSAGGYMRDVVLKPLVILVVSYMLGVAVANAERPERYLIPLFAGALVLPSVVAGFVASGHVTLTMLAGSHSRGFLSFLGIHANELGLMFNLGFALALFSALSAKTKVARLALIGAATFLAIAVLLTFSRGALLGLSAVCIYLLFKNRRFKIIACAVILAPLLALLLPQAVIERATTGVARGDMAAISAGRVGDIWIPLLPEVIHHPIFGQGLSSTLWSEAARRGAMLPVGHPHSAYLGMILDFGVVGSIFICAFFIFLWRYFRKLATATKGSVWEGYFLGASACVILLAVQGITDDRVTPTFSQIFLWLSFGIAIGMRARLDNKMNFDTTVIVKK